MKNKILDVMFGDKYFPENSLALVALVLGICGCVALYVGRTYESSVIKTDYVRARVIEIDPPKHVYAICIDSTNGVQFKVSLGKYCSGWNTIPIGSTVTVKRELHKYIRRNEPDFYMYDGATQIKSLMR
jgi:hypothetical protein